MQPTNREIAVFIFSAAGFAKRAAMGVARYAREQHGCGVHLLEVFNQPDWPKVIQQTQRYREIDGVVAFATAGTIEEQLLAMGVPAVNFSGQLYPAQSRLPRVMPDNHAFGMMAGEYLINLGIERIGYMGLPWLYYSELRGSGVRAAADSAGVDFYTLSTDDREAQARWIAQLPSPIGIVAAHDRAAIEIIDMALLAGKRIPEDIAVIGIDNDELHRSVGRVALSSIPGEGEQVGYSAAALVNRILDGHPAPHEPVLVPPRRVVERDSTNFLGGVDPKIASAITYLRTHACDGMNVEQVCRVSGISRSTLQRQCLALTGRTPHEEIRRVQINRAHELLAETQLSIAEVSQRCGFGKTAKYFMAEFKRRCGVTPTQWRRAGDSAVDDWRGVGKAGPTEL